MERAEWLKKMREQNEEMYDYFSPRYWVTFGLSEDTTHLVYLKKFLDRVARNVGLGQPGMLLSAACGAGRFDGVLVDAGHRVLGIDQSEKILARAREHFPAGQFPQLRYEKIGLQEMDFHAEFDGAICMDAMEHICPDDWPGILRGFHAALKPGGPLYFTADIRDPAEVEAAYRRGLAKGLPVVYGDIADEVDAASRQALEGGKVLDQCVYHYSPSLEQVRSWLEQAGLEIEEVVMGNEYHHILARKK